MAGQAGIFDSIKDVLSRVEARLREKPRLEYDVLSIAIEHLLSSGGKRIRPALVIFSSRLYSPAVTPEAVSLAAAVEMLHTASLVHDDLIDGSLLRRGIPTLNAEWTPGATILTGDYIFAHAADLAAQAGSLRVMRLFAETLMIICSGELKQQFSDLDTRARREDYFARIYAKTASLISLSTEAAGVLAGASEEQVTALREYGYNLGMAFQVVDDVLDFVGDESRLGKPVGIDLRQGQGASRGVYGSHQAQGSREQCYAGQGEHGSEAISHAQGEDPLPLDPQVGRTRTPRSQQGAQQPQPPRGDDQRQADVQVSEAEGELMASNGKGQAIGDERQ
jgi:geranylgeranyl pyrophosphate synthase